MNLLDVVMKNDEVKEYKAISSGLIYKMENGKLMKKNSKRCVFIISCIEFNELASTRVEEINLPFSEVVKTDDDYYFIDEDGEVCESIWEHDRTDRKRRDFMGIYRTREEAEKISDLIVETVRKYNEEK